MKCEEMIMDDRSYSIEEIIKTYEKLGINEQAQWANQPTVLYEKLQCTIPTMYENVPIVYRDNTSN